MTKPPAHKKIQDGYIKSGLRLPPDLHAEVQAAALFHGRTMNAEIIARLRKNPVEKLQRDNAELKKMVREILDLVRDKV
jgi:hypothetical protein